MGLRKPLKHIGIEEYSGAPNAFHCLPNVKRGRLNILGAKRLLNPIHERAIFGDRNG
jgi:hypothetical protein